MVSALTIRRVGFVQMNVRPLLKRNVLMREFESVKLTNMGVWSGVRGLIALAGPVQMMPPAMTFPSMIPLKIAAIQVR